MPTVTVARFRSSDCKSKMARVIGTNGKREEAVNTEGRHRSSPVRSNKSTLKSIHGEYHAISFNILGII